MKKKRGPKKGAKKAAAADKKTKKVKKEKKKKDPNAPKRPRSAFLYYSGKQRPNVKKENPSATFADVARILGEQWKALDANLKKVYSSPLSPLLSLFLGSSLSRTRSVEGPKDTNLKKVTSLYPILSLPPPPSLLPPSSLPLVSLHSLKENLSSAFADVAVKPGRPLMSLEERIPSPLPLLSFLSSPLVARIFS